jgi:uncharacterized protein with ParB-like and HNH nuclease domain/uncharacterized protein YueI
MKVESIYMPVGMFFKSESISVTPKYQRGYAWDKPEIDAFLTDLENVFNARKNGTPKNHFFGSMVIVKESLAGAFNKHKYEIVDGQQRISTFVLLATAILKHYMAIEKKCAEVHDTVNQAIVNKRIDKLKSRFIKFEQDINREITTLNVLKLSKYDNDFFLKLITFSMPNTIENAYNKRMDSAEKAIENRVKNLTQDDILAQYIDNLQILETNIDVDFSLLNIITDDKKEAYTLFQVLNNRGKSLTEGELLRARTLEMLESYSSQQDTIENYWDKILLDEPNQTEDYLRWIYNSKKGRSAGSRTLFDDYLEAFYPHYKKPNLTINEADEVQIETKKLLDEISNCRKLTNGEWVFPILQPIEAWDRNRLTLLVKELKSTNSMPLLLAACQLDHKRFSAIVQCVERFTFRYTIICNQHASHANAIYLAEAVAIRNNPSGYSLNNLKTKLKNLLETKANDNFFKSSLDTLIYKDSNNNGSNKALKYFLITIEDYLRWYREGNTAGEPICKDKSRLLAFADTTIEHIYPRNASGTVYDANLDDLKNRLGNLTIMGISDNGGKGDKSFAASRSVFTQSLIKMNNEIGNNTVWDRAAILDRADELKNIATAVFKIV